MSKLSLSRPAALLLTAALLSAAAVFVTADTLESRSALIVPALTVLTPEGDGPFPVVLLFHGCGGLVGQQGPKPIMDDYAKAAVAAGWAAVIVDSFKPRGIGAWRAVRSVCSGFELRGRARAGDVFASLEHLRRQPWVTGEHIVLAGWSHGGWAVMEALIGDPARDRPPRLKGLPEDVLASVAGVYLTYPYCGFPAGTRSKPWVIDVPGSIVLASDDEVAKRSDCEQAFASIEAGGVTLDIDIFENVTHAFDESDQIQDSDFVFDAAATARAHARFAAFLQALHPRPPADGT
jgi:dienelactone hydrolase